MDQNPVYGYYKELTLAEITARIDRAIADGYLKIEYNHRLPVLVYTEKGWEIEKETYAEELLEKLKALLNGMDYTFVKQLKDRDREMILLLLEKIKQPATAASSPCCTPGPLLSIKKCARRYTRLSTA